MQPVDIPAQCKRAHRMKSHSALNNIRPINTEVDLSK